MSACLLSESAPDRIATVEALETRIKSATGSRLKFLRVAFVAGRFRIIATCPSYHVRQLAEQAALGLLPADQLELYVHVSRPTRVSELR
jgi:hypothetical protein